MPPTQIQQAEALLNQGKFGEAEQRFQELAETDPHNKRTFNTLGIIAFQRHDILTAIARFTRALQLDPDYKTALINLASALRVTDCLADIADLLDQYAKQHPADADVAALRTEIRRETIKPLARVGVAEGAYEPVGILMITRNHLPALKRNLPVLLANTLIPFELTVVDMHSTDGTLEWLQGIHEILPVRHEIIVQSADAGMLEATQAFYDRSPCRFLVRVTPESEFHPGWLMELYHRCAPLAAPGEKFWLSRSAEAVHESLQLPAQSHLQDPRRYALFYEEQARDISVTRYGQDRMFHPEGNPRLNYVADCAEGNCLDIGCQYGAYTIWLAKQGHRVCAVDLSRSYLREARRRLADQPADVRDHVALLQCWGEHLPFALQSFQTVYLSEILEHVIAPEVVLTEALRVLKPGGVLYISVPGYSDETLEHVRQFTETSILELLSRFDTQLSLGTLTWYYRQPNDHFIFMVRRAGVDHP